MSPTPLDEVVGLFTLPSDEEADYHLGVKAVTLRIPIERLYWIDAMAEEAEVSRNAMLGKLVKVGISSVLAQLPDPIREGIESTVAEKAEENL